MIATDTRARTDTGPAHERTTMERPITNLFRRSNLLAGLLLIVIAAVLPTFAVLVNFQHELRREREAQSRDLALQRAELLSTVFGAVVAGTGHVLLTLSTLPQIRSADPACASLLPVVRQATPEYDLLALVGPDGAVICVDASFAPSPDVIAALKQPFEPATGFASGAYLQMPGTPAMLSTALSFTGAEGRQLRLVAGLSLSSLRAQLAAIQNQARGRIVIADRNGTVLVAAPTGSAEVGSQPDTQTRSLLGQPASGATDLMSPTGHQQTFGFVLPKANAAGLFVSVAFDAADLVAGIDRAARRSTMLILLGAALSLLLSLFIGHRYLRVPASVLLEAARRWGSGDLSARATMRRGAPQEFVGLGAAFNEMAESQQQQRSELQALNEALELRVADRTRALLDSNNRLQVEIAERELSEASLRQAQKLQAVGQLAGGMAHEFTNLLTAILGSLDLLRRRVDVSDPRIERLIDTGTEAVERGSRLTSQLLSFSRKLPLLAVSVDVAGAISGMAGLLASTLGANVRLETRVNDELWPALLDPNQFEASLLNLALNARDAMPSGGRLTLSAANAVITPDSPWPELTPGEYVSVTVTDSGVGMSADVAARAFEPFFTTKLPGQGTGLGLSQVYGMVHQSGGSVIISSRPNEGAKVTMMLPRSLAQLADDRPELDYSLPALRRTRPLLLVDDDAAVREVTEAILVENGYTVLTAMDGATALEMLDEAGRGQGGQSISLVIADYSMPGMTGVELLQLVKQRWPGIAVMLATGYADYSDLTGQELPIDQIVRKPFRINELLARVHLVIRRQAVLEEAAPSA